MTERKQLTVKIATDLAELKRDMRIAREEFSKFGSSLSGLSRVLAGIAGATGLAAFGKQLIDAGDELQKLAQKFASTPEKLSAFIAGAELAGASTEDLKTGLTHLASAMDEAVSNKASKAGRIFESLGIAVTDSAGKLRSLDEVLADVARAFQNASDSTEKTALARALFGKGGVNLIPFLNDMEALTGEVERLGHTVSTDFANQSAAFNDNLTRSARNLQALGRSILGDVLPHLNSLIERLNVAAGAQEKLSIETLEFERARLGAEFTALSNRPTGPLWKQDAVEREKAAILRAIDEVDAKIIEYNRKRIAEQDAQKTKRTLPSVGAIEASAKMQEALAKEADAVKRAVDPLFVYEQQLDKINRLKEAGLLNDEQWAAAQLAAADAYEKSTTVVDAYGQELDRLVESVRAQINPYRELEQQMVKLRDAFERGKISEQEFAEAQLHFADRFAQIGPVVAETTKKMDEFAVNAAQNIQGALGDELYNILSGNFSDIGAAFSRMLTRMAAEAAAANIARALFPAIGLPLFHDGGVVGKSAPMRQVDSGSFLGVPRYHAGGVAGLRSDEVPAILQRGEVVIPRDQLNGAGRVPSIAINVDNRSTMPLQMNVANIREEAERFVVNVIVEDAINGGAAINSVRRALSR